MSEPDELTPLEGVARLGARAEEMLTALSELRQLRKKLAEAKAQLALIHCLSRREGIGTRRSFEAMLDQIREVSAP